ncbi:MULTISPECIES: type 1 glutamine amidotransferase domain-containing protein [Micrococcus]|uniref:type 1 glutamine amidotransferase domain-containing protein n=1 Tax=Micrococcus TaxID=1269 RepID=UPI001153850E|nr:MULTISPECIES: type 1 glutamine amidotransferase domain-containing protein [Micrococcus]MBE1539298.1 protease I [Micrococcus yunnanensis]TQF66214.1 type 1 glutamine amidotransferase [Micrococcus sp. R8502A1]
MTENAVQNAPLTGKTVAFLATDGVEQVELTSPWEAVIAAGATPVLVSPKSGTITAMKSDWEHGESFEVNTTVKDAKAEDFHGLVMPGGTLNADALRIDTDAQAFVRAFFEQHKPVAAICHAPWTLIEAGVVDGRRLTSYASLESDLKNAGAQWVDEEVVVDNGLTTSRTPDDLDAFNAKLVEELGEGKHEDQTA